jgi:hypothetical protein
MLLPQLIARRLQATTLLLSRMRTSPTSVTPAMVTALFAALGKLGMTPHGRTQLNAVQEPETSDNSLLEFVTY